jgi:hypothetical protein
LLKRQLQTIAQVYWSCTDFIKEARSLVDQLVATRKTNNDQNLISFLLRGL